MANLIHSFRRLTLLTGLVLAAFARSSAAAGLATDATAGERTPETIAADAARPYAFETLDFPGSSLTIVWGLDDFDDVAGQYAIAGGTSHAMVRRHGQFKALAPRETGTGFSAAGGPNDIGTTFGGYTDAAGAQHGFVITDGRFEKVDFRGHLNSNIDAVDVSGAILGVYWDADGVYHGMLSRHGNETPFDVGGARDTYPLGMNSEGDSVGYWDTDGVTVQGYVRRADGQVSVLNLPAATATVAFAINDFGQIAGYFEDASGGIHGYVKTGQHLRQVDMPGALATLVTSLNNWGSVAGEYIDASGTRHGFLARLK